MKTINDYVFSKLTGAFSSCAVNGILLVLAICLHGNAWAVPVGTTFTYQGAISDEGGATSFDLRFELWNAESGGTRVAGPLTLSAVDASSGHFTVNLDFGGAPFNGEAVWLRIEARPSGGTAAYETLTPRQKVTPTPYALHALTAGAAQTVAAGTVTTAGLAPGAVTSDRIANGTIVAEDLSPGLLDGTAWQLGGNSGTTPGTDFIGTMDNRALEFRVNNITAGRIEPASSGASIAFGGQASLGAGLTAATISGGRLNTILPGAHYSLIGGGYNNRLDSNSLFSAISAGYFNRVDRRIFTGEFAQTNDSEFSVISGGADNFIHGASWSVISGGMDNQAVGDYSTVAGGRDNIASTYAFAAGRRAKATHTGAFVWADSFNGDFVSTRLNEFAVRAEGGMRVQSNRGLNLNAADGPLITRAWDVFSASAPLHKTGLGRWGVFMEPHSLVLGMPAVAGKYIRFGSYAEDGTFTSLAHIEQNGTLRTAGSVNPPSDRNVKQDFQSIKPNLILEKVLALPVQTWSYTNSPTVRHIGPVAQDFHASFGLGPDDKTIATVDADGIALAAIQGLNQKFIEEVGSLRKAVDSREKEINDLKKELLAMQARESKRDQQIAALLRGLRQEQASNKR